MGRAPCCEKNGLKKGPWTPEEDQKLIDYIQKHSYGNWRTLPKNAGLHRCGKSCRLRWTNYLRPDIKRGGFTFEEEETIIQLHSILGNKWSAIAARLPGRTDNEIKNYWNTHIRKRLLRMGIDPVTHNPRLDLLDLSSILSPSLYNSSQMNLSRLLGLQPLVNPEILRLANSLMSSQRENQTIVLQNGQKNQLSNPQIQNQFQEVLAQDVNQLQSQLSQQVPTCTSLASPCMAFSNATSQISDPNMEQYCSNLSNFSTQLQSHDLESQIDSNLNEDYLYAPSYYNDYSFASHHGNLLDDSSENETFIPQNNFVINNNMSDLSTPSSSPTPLNSNSTCINGGSSSITTEDEGNMMKFEIPDDILDVNNFMYYENPSD